MVRMRDIRCVTLDFSSRLPGPAVLALLAAACGSTSPTKPPASSPAAPEARPAEPEKAKAEAPPLAEVNFGTTLLATDWIDRDESNDQRSDGAVWETCVGGSCTAAKTRRECAALPTAPADVAQVTDRLATCLRTTRGITQFPGGRFLMRLELSPDGHIQATAPSLPKDPLRDCIELAWQSARLSFPPRPKNAQSQSAILLLTLADDPQPTDAAVDVSLSLTNVVLGEEVLAAGLDWQADRANQILVMRNALRSIRDRAFGLVTFRIADDVSDLGVVIALHAAPWPREYLRLARSTDAGWQRLRWRTKPLDVFNDCAGLVTPMTLTIRNGAEQILVSGAATAAFPATTSGATEAADLACGLRDKALRGRSDIYIRPAGGSYGVLAEILQRTTECGFFDATLLYE